MELNLAGFALVLAVMGGLAAPLHGVLALPNIVMLFLLVVAAALRYGRGPAGLAAFLGVALFDFFFVPPLLSFDVGDAQYLIAFAVMLGVGLVIGQLTASLRAQARAATERGRRVRDLCQMSRELSSALLARQVADIGVRFLQAEFGARSALLVLGNDEHLAVEAGANARWTWRWRNGVSTKASRQARAPTPCPQRPA